MKRRLLRGIGINKSKGIGKIKCISSINDFDKIADGDVIISKAATPDFILILSKIRCLITDEGGLTSHIAIVCRELGTPAIVGTGKATQLLKPGMEIKFNTISGTITFI
jgi:pyruvate,water dikinase